MSKLTFILSLISFLFLPSLIISSCTPNENNCIQCNPLTNLCYKCSNQAYTPDNEGGCTPAKKCIVGTNFCTVCNEKSDSCLVCEVGYYPDENGGCSYTNNCLISLNGHCLECKNDFLLIGQNENLKICKYKYLDNLSNCKNINLNNGICTLCNDGYYLTENDKKCIKNTDNCSEANFGVCQKCIFGYYLDKNDDKCKIAENDLSFCKISLDGKKCDECFDDYYFTEDGKCVFSNFCKERDNENNYCIKCIEGYFLSQFGNTCTLTENCESADKDFGICSSCQKNLYLNINEKKCFSNKENNDYKNCIELNEKNLCIKCESGFFISEDFKCVDTANCLESENGICKKCIENYYLGIDNHCSDDEHCIKSSYNIKCIECENNYYYNYTSEKCEKETDNMKNCKNTDYIGRKCENCKSGFYLNKTDYLCYDNSDKNNHFYKCEKTSDYAIYCSYCEDGYYLGYKDNKCSKVFGCIESIDENSCLECDEYYFCLDQKTKQCEDKLFPPENENKIIYYNCNKTNENGDGCEECTDDFLEIKNGICVNNKECSDIIDDECVKCIDVSHNGYNMCLNKVYGCVDTFVSNCLKCDNISDFDFCTECEEGFELDENGDCVEK